MFPVSLRQLIQITGGIATPGCSGTSLHATGGSIDSRSLLPGDLFFALPGVNSHGVDFAEAAVRNGAACVITDIQPDASLNQLPVVIVPDTLQAMRQVAAWCRDQSSALVIGITGSVGKTTTRQMIAQVLSSRFRGIQSPASYNNHLGVPLSLMLLNADIEYAVLELGASAPGEIAELAGLARPAVAVVTRVSPAHLTGFGSLQKIRQAKAELPAAISSSGTVFLNGDDPLVSQMATDTSARVVLFGESQNCEVRTTDIELTAASVSFQVDGHHYRLKAAGRHLVTCAAAAVAVGLSAGLTAEQISTELEKFQPDRGRGRVLTTHPWTLIDDSYNASPASVAATVDVLSAQQTPGNRILVLGDMLELAEQSSQLHHEVGMMIGRSAIQKILLLGEHAEEVAAGIRRIRGNSIGNDVFVFRDQRQLFIRLQQMLHPGDIILVKGSRGMQMEQIVRRLTEQGSD